MERSPSIEVEKASIAPGGKTRITASAANITEAKMGWPSPEWKIEYKRPSPSPKITWQCRPPVWEWESPQPEVTIEAVLYAPDKPSQEKYYYSVRVRNCEENYNGEWITGTGVIELPNGQ
ncbi:hypothetical protein [Natrarchaeobaculum aegyptiacum]|uniref:hypothetical protein n=1 Tax=Natrarchaeobaculum aegyptiacum TaxID=745377 RepID=UPI00126012EE|nr:hypothetical protein [Natrarchaeobaculum aegyptiacum]